MSKYLPYHAESAAYAKALVKDAKTDFEKYQLITNYVSRSFGYDYIRAIQVPKKNAYPDVATCWERHLGICMDIASMTTMMLQAVGLNAMMVYGHTEKSYHAWVEVIINGKTYRYDHDGKAKMYKRERVFKK